MASNHEKQNTLLNNLEMDSSSSVVMKYSNYVHNETMQGLCKTILKAKLFRGYYTERRYVETLREYRDIVALQITERDLQKLLLDLKIKLQSFYNQVQPGNNIWIGITNGPLSGSELQLGALDTYIWTYILDGLAFGQYWFSIKNVRFRQNEIIIKLKMIRPVDLELQKLSCTRSMRSVTPTHSNTNVIKPSNSNEIALVPGMSEIKPVENCTTGRDIGIQDFVDIVQKWGTQIKHSAYDFLANDISKDNMKGTIKLIGLIIMSILTGIFLSVKMLGIFIIRLTFEVSRLSSVWSPILIKIIDVLSKIIGGFYLLLTMIWKDFMTNRQNQQKRTQYETIKYKGPLHRSLEYDSRHNNQRSTPTTFTSNFDRNFPRYTDSTGTWTKTRLNINKFE